MHSRSAAPSRGLLALSLTLHSPAMTSTSLGLGQIGRFVSGMPTQVIRCNRPVEFSLPGTAVPSLTFLQRRLCSWPSHNVLAFTSSVPTPTQMFPFPVVCPLQLQSSAVVPDKYRVAGTLLATTCLLL